MLTGKRFCFQDDSTALYMKSECVIPLSGAVVRLKVLTPSLRSTRGALLKPCWLIWSRTLTSVEGLHRRPRAVYKYWASYVVFFAFSIVGVEKVTVESPQLQFFDRGRCARAARWILDIWVDSVFGSCV